MVLTSRLAAATVKTLCEAARSRTDTNELQQIAARSFSSSAGLRASSSAPIILHGIDGRYATALFNAAAKSNATDKVETELKNVESVIRKDTSVRSFLETPLLDRSAKTAGVKTMLSKGKYSPVVHNFFELLAENSRLDQTLKIISAYGQLMMAARGEVTVTVTSAKELDGKTLGRLKDILTKSSLVEKSAKLLVTNKVQPEIIGGLVIEVGDKTIDMSVSSKVSKLNRILTEAI